MDYRCLLNGHNSESREQIQERQKKKKNKKTSGLYMFMENVNNMSRLISILVQFGGYMHSIIFQCSLSLVFLDLLTCCLFWLERSSPLCCLWTNIISKASLIWHNVPLHSHFMQRHTTLSHHHYSLKFFVSYLLLRLTITTSVPNYKTLLRIFFVPFYKIPLLFPTTLIISLHTYTYLLYIFFFN
jgi:hypothetical protein